MASTGTYAASSLITPYYSSNSRYTLEAAVQGARWRNDTSYQMVGLVFIPSIASVPWTGKIINSASLTVTIRSLTKYDTIRLYGSNYNQYNSSRAGSEYLDTGNGYTDIAIGSTTVGDHTVSLTSSNISWLISQLRMGRTAFCMYYAGDTATSSVQQSTHYLGVNAFSLSINYDDAKSVITSCSNANIGSTTTLSWTNYATTGRTCKVRFTLGSADSGEISASGSSYTYTLPSSWYNQLPTSTSGTATAHLYTYINSTKVGTDTITFKASVPSNIVPSIGSISATKQNSNATVNTWDIWLQNYTQSVISVAGCAAGTGATISSYAFSGQGLQQTVSTSSASASATSDIIQVDGTHTYSVKITDSRGRTASNTVNVTVLPYSAPNISYAGAVRCDANGTENSATGTYGKAYIVYTWSNVGSNAITNNISYKLHSDNTYTLVENNIASLTWSSVFGTLDIASAYDVQGYIVDSLGNSSTYDTNIYSVSGISFGLKNDRARFGGVTEKAGLQIDWPTDIKNTLEINTDNPYPIRIRDNNGNLAYQMINYNGTNQASFYDVGTERNYIGDGRFSTYSTSGVEVDRISQAGSFFGSNVNHTGTLTVNNKPVVLTVNNSSPDANGNVTVSGGGSGNLRSCSASLSSSGWYRIVNADFNSSSIAQGSSGMVVELHIVREGLSGSAESHDIIYRSINGGSGSFSGERSKSGTQYIDKVRYTYDADGHIDLHYTGSASNKVTVYFNVYINPSDQSAVTDGSLAAVADAPTGETILLTYSFASQVATPLEYGITGSWRYRKWSDGRIEIWGIPKVTFTLTTVGVYHRGSFTFDLPFTLSDLETLQMTAYKDTLWYCLGNFTNGKTVTGYGYDVVDASNYSTYVSVYAIGTI